MSNYQLVEKEAFTVLGIGVELKSDYTDFAGITKEKHDFWEQVTQDGTLTKLKELADNDYIFAVNEAYDNKMMHYAGVLTEKTLPEATRIIQFPKSTYVVVSGEADSSEELQNVLTGMAFGQALVELQDYQYVGGPNAAVEMGQKDGKFFGEMWIPVVAK
ncbi:effector binding domain-containing protein [Enterococcus saccharolyticus]|uniref:Transcriptional regulator n=1 Tax=Candidatus Enterococcus willemsii TaxID=1857215 RepID=A0ABQ6YW87_9ENTE|nr:MULTISPECIES: GyrI-like domain-containing protein [Enterococcus]KAF1301966.1 transcriptional regulator [Enterococcus sp. CU12B]MCD5002926.1 effector binding domain-containing protein [Enterococcus saccharolyticus]